MSRVRITLMAASIALGLFLALAAPVTWGIDPGHGVLLGFALYAGALRRYAARRERETEVDPAPGSRARVLATGLVLRAAAFFAVAGAQTYILFVAAPGADLRAAFVILSSWIVLESAVDPIGAARAGGSRRVGGAGEAAAERC